MHTIQQSNWHWTPCDSYSSLISQLSELRLKVSQLVTTDSPNSWGYVLFGSDIAIPIGYADMGLPPAAARHDAQVFIGINELLIGCNLSDHNLLFKYQMPTVFHEFVRFDTKELIIRDEIGFVGVSYFGEEHWSYCINDMIANYEINQSIISGRTEGGKVFRYDIPLPAKLM